MKKKTSKLEDTSDKERNTELDNKKKRRTSEFEDTSDEEKSTEFDNDEEKSTKLDDINNEKKDRSTK
ncbi:25009_t:CDS:2 [Dentiscutata erythropus]|uniref:25009_t:CDS:1 n=1 Tax=Dentiscutata erythropus TaxID=1348616 RepID=A0A9N9GDV0_9GLOM|nr:25009_t:CDS:2 [Dentiscutata erythropus]